MRKKLRILPLAALAVVAAALFLGGPMASAVGVNEDGQANQAGVEEPDGANNQEGTDEADGQNGDAEN